MLQTKGTWEDFENFSDDIFLNQYSKFIKAIENEDKKAIYFRAMDIVNLSKDGNEKAKNFLPFVLKYCPDIRNEVINI